MIMLPFVKTTKLIFGIAFEIQISKHSNFGGHNFAVCGAGINMTIFVAQLLLFGIMLLFRGQRNVSSE